METMQISTEELRAAVLNARAAELNAAVAGMVTANTERQANGYALAYDEGAFFRDIEESGLDKDTVTRLAIHGVL